MHTDAKVSYIQPVPTHICFRPSHEGSQLTSVINCLLHIKHQDIQIVPIHSRQENTKQNFDDYSTSRFTQYAQDTHFATYPKKQKHNLDILQKTM